MGLALAQHLGEIVLGSCIQKQNLFVVQCNASPQVIDGGAFTNAAFLVHYTYHIGFRHIGVSCLSVDLAACGETDGYVWE